MSSPTIYPSALDKSKKVKWIISLIVTLIIMIIPTNDTFTPNIRNFFAITILFILVSAFDLLDNYIPSLFLPAAYIIFGVTTADIALASWLNELPWVMLSAFLLVNVVEKTGLLKRVAFWIIIRTGGTYNGILWGIFIAGVILNFFLPGGAIVPLIAMAYGICIALELQGTKEAAGIMIASSIGAIMPTMFIYAPAFFGLVYNAAKAGVPDIPEVSYLELIGRNIIYLPFLIILVFLTSKMFKPEKSLQGKDYFISEYKKLNKLSNPEIRATFVVLALVIYLVTMNIHHRGMGWGFMLAAVAMYLPGINLGTKEDIRNVNMSVVLFAGSCLSIGTVATSLGIGTIVTNMVMPFLEGHGAVAFLLVVMIIAFILNFIMTPAAIMAILAAPLAQLALQLNVDVITTLSVLNSAAYQIIFPYEHSSFLILFSFGLISSKYFMKFFGITSIIHFIYVLAIAIPVWSLLGML